MENEGILISCCLSKLLDNELKACKLAVEQQTKINVRLIYKTEGVEILG